MALPSFTKIYKKGGDTMPERSKRICFYDDEKLKAINPENLALWKKYKVDMTLRDLSQNTINSYENDLHQWFIYILDNQGNQKVTELTEDDITEFLFYCKTQGNNTGRMKRRMSSIAAFYKFLRKKKLIIENPTEFLDRPKHGLPIIQQTFLTKEQVEQLRQKLTEYGNLQIQTYVMFSLSTMARVNAVAHIRWDMIDFENRVVSNVLEKEGKIVDLFFSEEVKDLLLRLQTDRKEKGIDDLGWVFYTSRCDETKPVSKSTLNDWCKLAGSLIGVETLHPHDFRHSAANLLKKAGMPLEDVATLLNHIDTSTTVKHYLKPDTSRITDMKDKFNI